MNYNKKGMEEHVHKEKEKKKEEQKEEKKNTKKNSNQYDIFFVIMSILNFFIVILTIIFLLIFLFLPNSFQGNNIDEYNNDFCQNKLNENYDLLCTNKYYKNNYKKSKFIWIFTDGTASDQLTILNNYEKYKISSKFLVKGDDITYKHTNELHQALLSGKHNRNILGKEINFDHVIKQLKNAGYKINYRGWSLPIPDIIGETNGKNENKFFYKQFIDDDHEITAFSSFCNLTNPFPFLELKYDKHQNQIPNDELPPLKSSGIRIGTAAMTTKGWDKDKFIKLADIMDEVLRAYAEEYKKYGDNTINIISANYVDAVMDLVRE